MRYNYTIINSGVNLNGDYNMDSPTEKNILKVWHNAGFFSCCTIRLLDIIAYFNKNASLPDEVDSSEQFLHYKGYPGENMMPVYFNQEAEQLELQCSYPVNIRMDCMAIQFDSYSNLDFKNIVPFVKKYFMPSINVLQYAAEFKLKYKLDYPNLCAVFYRGNDKATEMKIAPYGMFIEMAHKIKASNPNIRFLVQPDEKEFLDAFLAVFPDSIYFTETPMLNKSNTSMFFEVPINERPAYGAKFFAAVLCLSQCSNVITHSGNGALWLSLYRGNSINVNQIFNNEWI